MQTVEKGADPQTLTSAEFAAMFDFNMLPALCACFGEGEEFDNHCKAFAQRIGKPDQWRSISLPAYISWDSATIHPWARQLMCAPRVDSGVINEYVKLRIAEELKVAVPPDWKAVQPGLSPLDQTPLPPPPQPPGSHHRHIRSFLQPNATQGEAQGAAAQPAQPADAAATQAAAAVHKALEAALAKYSKDNNGASFVDVCKREMARTDPAMRCIWPQQWMPLYKVTPDIHSPVEHMVGTIKLFLKRKMRENLCKGDDLLLQAKTYQDWVLQAVQEKGIGEAGTRHITRSIDKQKCICMILAAEKDEDVTLHYTFMGQDTQVGNKKTTHVKKGRAGDWILERRWT